VVQFFFGTECSWSQFWGKKGVCGGVCYFAIFSTYWQLQNNNLTVDSVFPSELTPRKFIRTIPYLLRYIFWATICKTVRPMLSDCCLCLSVLFVTLVHCGQIVGRIKMKFAMQVSLGNSWLIMAALRSRCRHYIYVLFPSFFFLPGLISAVADWMSTTLLHMVRPLCEFRMQVWNVLHAARWKCRTQK